MNWSRTRTPRLLLRTFAAAMLVAWVGALALCSEICCTGGDAAVAESAHSHANADADSHHRDDGSAPNHGPCTSASCETLQNALLGSKAVVVHPQLALLYNLPDFHFTLHGLDPIIHLNSRQARPRDWVFTPEVCLGPAFRSLAPPLV